MCGNNDCGSAAVAAIAEVQQLQIYESCRYTAVTNARLGAENSAPRLAIKCGKHTAFFIN